MNTHQYRSEEDIFLFLHIFQLMADNYQRNHFKLILVKHYPDLLPHINHFDIDEVSEELIANSNDELNKWIDRSIDSILWAKFELVFRYSIDLKECNDNGECAELAKRYYDHMVKDPFPVDGIGLALANQPWPEYLRHFHNSLLNLTGTLLDVFNTACGNFSFALDKKIKVRKRERAVILGFINEDAAEAFKRLSNSLLTFYFDIYEVLYPDQP